MLDSVLVIVSVLSSRQGKALLRTHSICLVRRKIQLSRNAPTTYLGHCILGKMCHFENAEILPASWAHMQFKSQRLAESAAQRESNASLTRRNKIRIERAMSTLNVQFRRSTQSTNVQPKVIMLNANL